MLTGVLRKKVRSSYLLLVEVGQTALSATTSTVLVVVIMLEVEQVHDLARRGRLFEGVIG